MYLCIYKCFVNNHRYVLQKNANLVIIIVLGKGSSILIFLGGKAKHYIVLPRPFLLILLNDSLPITQLDEEMW